MNGAGKKADRRHPNHEEIKFSIINMILFVLLLRFSSFAITQRIEFRGKDLNEPNERITNHKMIGKII